MRFKYITFLLLLSSLSGPLSVNAQAPADTIYNPTILFTGLPKTYEIADIQVKGANNYEDYIIINYTGLKPGDIITIPGPDLTNASKELWRQGLFSKVQITVDKVVGNKVYRLTSVSSRASVPSTTTESRKANSRTLKRLCSSGRAIRLPRTSSTVRSR